MPECPCPDPLWPCAMTGAVACLSGFSGLEVVIHGSSGCYFYPASLLKRPVHATLIIEDEVIMGSENRLRSVVSEVASSGLPVAVVLSCVPAVLGEDIRGALDGMDVIVVDSPGFAGRMEEGYMRALAAVAPEVEEGEDGVTIDGLNPVDPFYKGNLYETQRLVALAGGRVAAALAAGPFEQVKRCGPVTLQTDPDLPSGIGRTAGSLLGLEATVATVSKAADHCGLDSTPVAKEAQAAEERIDHLCDKFLARHDPPSAAVFGGRAYADFAARALRRYLDAEIVSLAPRNGEGAAVSLEEMQDRIAATDPDLILGSSYEHAAAPHVPYVGLTFPQRGQARLHARPIVGVEGTLALMESVLNACGRT
ncbi:nitrogenase molybdenum-iron protein alpha/beta subunit [Methanofollis sp. W23]|uniref:nitrogenase component 1 n=1 Tax=Methanofollis sp. W23 TaxID=2817849 RepID=UPI001AEA52EA|nr:nitrogenase component 1 [Methanofollis sp. W23]MBP2145749.1 nitrogenase molybdenum-iron protein alpha/beta subunit [Methanofollis sp. W23]